MKTMKTIIAILILNTFFTNCLNAQSDTGSVWVTFNNQLDVPVLSGGKLVSSKREIQQLIEQFNIYDVTQALPDSKPRPSTEGMTRITGRGTGSRKSTNKGSS